MMVSRISCDPIVVQDARIGRMDAVIAVKVDAIAVSAHLDGAGACSWCCYIWCCCIVLVLLMDGVGAAGSAIGAIHEFADLVLLMMVLAGAGAVVLCCCGIVL